MYCILSSGHRYLFLCTECKPDFNCHKNGIAHGNGENPDQPGTELTTAEDAAGTKGVCICEGTDKFFHPNNNNYNPCQPKSVKETPGGVNHGFDCGLVGASSKFLICRIFRSAHVGIYTSGKLTP